MIYGRQAGYLAAVPPRTILPIGVISIIKGLKGSRQSHDACIYQPERR
jgi:hypothetical protein